MPNQPKTPATSIRLTPEDRAIIDSLGQRLAPLDGAPLTITEIVRIALRGLDRATKKKPEKSSKVY